MYKICTFINDSAPTASLSEYIRVVEINGHKKVRGFGDGSIDDVILLQHPA